MKPAVNALTDYQAVIFDMDGVIVDSEPRHERAVLEVIDEIGHGRDHGLRVSDYIGRSDQDVWRDFIARNKPRQTLDQLLAMKRQRTVEILRREQPVFPGVIALLEQLAARCPLALASGSEQAVVEAVLELKDMGRFFSAVVTGSEIDRGKPAPDIFLKAAARLGVGPQACWVIEDSKPGIAAARAAGMRVIAITNTHPAAELQHATHVVETYEEIARHLRGSPGATSP
jgi:HAD superfamily hydrolase (TIGR01509 family)